MPCGPIRQWKKKNEGVRIYDEDLEKVIKDREEEYHSHLEK
jgi:hypothetical protein